MGQEWKRLFVIEWGNLKVFAKVSVLRVWVVDVAVDAVVDAVAWLVVNAEIRDQTGLFW